jgi:hypothetical protein
MLTDHVTLQCEYEHKAIKQCGIDMDSISIAVSRLTVFIILQIGR